MKNDEPILKDLTDLGLTQKQIAAFAGTSESRLSEDIYSETRKFFNSKRLANLCKSLSKRRNRDEIRCYKIVVQAYLRECRECANLSKDEFITHTLAMQMLRGTPTAIWMITEIASITDKVNDLMAAANSQETLVIAVHSELSDEAISAMESWAYGEKGNYLDRKGVRLVKLESPPITEMVGGFKDGVFHGFMDVGEGFAPLDIPELSFLKEELEALMREELPAGASLAWSLPVTPEARIIEHVLRHAESPLPEEAKDYLIERKKGFEEEGGGLDADPPWSWVYGMLPQEIESRFGSEAAGRIRIALETLKMKTT